MEIIELKPRADIAQNKKLNATFVQFQDVILALKKVDIPDALVTTINAEIECANASNLSGKALIKVLHVSQSKILKHIEVELKLVPKGHYRNLWIALGMVVFGVPFGAIYGMMIDNIAFMGLGLSAGLPIGLAIGVSLDKKALKEGRQLDVELKL